MHKNKDSLIGNTTNTFTKKTNKTSTPKIYKNMKYKVLKQSIYNERDFTLEREDGSIFHAVDIYTGGDLEPPKEYFEASEQGKPEKANQIFEEWLSSFVGKILEIDELVAASYFAHNLKETNKGDQQ